MEVSTGISNGEGEGQGETEGQRDRECTEFEQAIAPRQSTQSRFAISFLSPVRAISLGKKEIHHDVECKPFRALPMPHGFSCFFFLFFHALWPMLPGILSFIPSNNPWIVPLLVYRQLKSDLLYSAGSKAFRHSSQSLQKRVQKWQPPKSTLERSCRLSADRKTLFFHPGFCEKGENFATSFRCHLMMSERSCRIFASTDSRVSDFSIPLNEAFFFYQFWNEYKQKHLVVTSAEEKASATEYSWYENSPDPLSKVASTLFRRDTRLPDTFLHHIFVQYSLGNRLPRIVPGNGRLKRWKNEPCGEMNEKREWEIEKRERL